jgi:uncharacterized membrane protein
MLTKNVRKPSMLKTLVIIYIFIFVTQQLGKIKKKKKKKTQINTSKKKRKEKKKKRKNYKNIIKEKKVEYYCEVISYKVIIFML